MTKDKKEIKKDKKICKVAKLEHENAELKDKLLRAMSETENLRKRSQKEISDMATYSVSKFAKEMLLVSDNLKRAIASIPTKAIEEDEALNNLFKGVNATQSQLIKILQNFNIKQIKCEGIFDPNLHEVMIEQENEAESGTILTVLEDGFTIGDRLLRPARVIVSK